VAHGNHRARPIPLLSHSRDLSLHMTGRTNGITPRPDQCVIPSMIRSRSGDHWPLPLAKSTSGVRGQRPRQRDGGRGVFQLAERAPCRRRAVTANPSIHPGDRVCVMNRLNFGVGFFGRSSFDHPVCQDRPPIQCGPHLRHPEARPDRGFRTVHNACSTVTTRTRSGSLPFTA
jgi:hypothetical protein